ncbi:MAG: L,D-transpeptidase [Rhabdochlamydiaceae bacterium]
MSKLKFFFLVSVLSGLTYIAFFRHDKKEPGLRPPSKKTFLSFSSKENKQYLAKQEEYRVLKKEADDLKKMEQNLSTSLTSINTDVNTISKASYEMGSVDRIQQLFTTGPNKLPIVETVSYSSKVPWVKGRPAWIADYAVHFSTSRHFIARSLNAKPDYFTQKVGMGSRFNVFRKDKNIHFHLVVDLSSRKMAFYYHDLDTNERVLIKTYKVGLGRIENNLVASCLTPLGDYKLGSKVAIYAPGVTGYFQDKKVEMIRVFGTRWMPLESLETHESNSKKNYGIQGAPWSEDKEGVLKENKDLIGKYNSDGCIRLLSEDLEELFAILITKPTFVQIVKEFKDCKLPGIEVVIPTR